MYVKNQGNEVSQKVLKHLSLKPRLQSLFVVKKLVEDMRWHNDKRVDDRVTLRHLVDALVEKEFDRLHQLFASDPRSVCLGLASGGFNPCGNMSSQHSTWFIILV